MTLSFCLPFIAYGCMLLFKRQHWTVTNFEGKETPYSLGGFVLLSYLLNTYFLPDESMEKSVYVFVYIIGLWGIGLIDDVFGDRKPKGIKGHFRNFIKSGKVSTGLLKVIGTLGLTCFFLTHLSPPTGEAWIRYGIILILLPHVFNLFDTRPLRVWKVSLIFCLIFLPLMNTVPFSMGIYILTFIFVFAVFEGHRLAMLGDNGSTLVGGIIAVLSIFYLTSFQQWILILVIVFLTLFAEYRSFNQIIDNSRILSIIDRWGLSSSRR